MRRIDILFTPQEGSLNPGHPLSKVLLGTFIHPCRFIEQELMCCGGRARIEGSNISLDSPEAIAKWIADRKKRWPSNQVVEDKVRSSLFCIIAFLT